MYLGFLAFLQTDTHDLRHFCSCDRHWGLCCFVGSCQQCWMAATIVGTLPLLESGADSTAVVLLFVCFVVIKPPQLEEVLFRKSLVWRSLGNLCWQVTTKQNCVFGSGKQVPAATRDARTPIPFPTRRPVRARAHTLPNEKSTFGAFGTKLYQTNAYRLSDPVLLFHTAWAANGAPFLDELDTRISLARANNIIEWRTCALHVRTKRKSEVNSELVVKRREPLTW